MRLTEKTLSALAVALSVFAFHPASAADPNLSMAFSAIKDAYLVGVERNRNATRDSHVEWCRSVSGAQCEAALKDYLRRLRGPSRVEFIGLDDTCYVAANLKEARETLTGRRTGPRGGHYGWCRGNAGRATAFAQEEIRMMETRFPEPGP